MNRRDSLRWMATASLAGVAGLTAPSRTAEAQTAKPWKTAIGLNGFESSSRKYQKNYPIWEVLDFAANEGFDGVELVESWPWSGYPQTEEKGRIQALRRMYDAFHLQVFSIQLGAAGAFDPEETGRQAWLKEFEQRARLAQALGCSCIGMWPGGGLRGQTIDEALERLGQSFHRAAEIAAGLELVTAFEIEPPFVFNTEEHVKRILAAGDHPNLKAIYDPSHYDLMNGSLGRPHEMLQRVGVDRVGYVHLTDTDGTLRDGGTSKHLPCGDGHAQIEKSLQLLREGGFRGWIMIDAWEIPDSYDACRKGKSMIDRFNQPG